MADSLFNLSSLNGSNGFIINGINGIDSNGNSDGSGTSVSSAGDINGDGLDDLIIGAYKAGSGAGQSYVVFGSKSQFNTTLNLSSLNGSNGFSINGSNAEASGFSVSSAGDVNDDGIDDLIIGADNASSNAGKSYVVFGSKSTFNASLDLSSLNGTNGFVINGVNGGDFFGDSVSSAGDVNGDGIDDLIVGAYGATSDGGQTGAGKSYVVFGKKNGFSSSLNLSKLDGTNGFAINGINASDNSGYSVKSAGDINGDGIEDLIIGAPVATGGAGQSYVVFGTKNGFSSSLNFSDLNGTNGFAINGIANDISGGSVSSAGDINGDGIDDLIIGAFSASSNEGKSYVVFGSKNGFSASLDLSALDGTNGFSISGINANDTFGTSVSGAGDVNHDGIDDLIIGAPSASSSTSSNPGQSYIVYGSKNSFSPNFNVSNLDGSNGFAINGIKNQDAFGTSVSSGGDINGDGIDDVIIGAPNAATGAGQSYVVFGKVVPPPEPKSPIVLPTSAIFNLSSLNGSNGFVIKGINGIDSNGNSDGSGTSVSSAGDINGDGLDDLIIGAYKAGSGAGQSYVVFGSKSQFNTTLNLSSLNGSNGFSINGSNAEASGFSVSSAGDVNDDGIGDLIIGADNASSNAGKSYVVFGSKSTFNASLDLSSLNGTNGFVINGVNGGDFFGDSVSSAGDVNGDGIDDLIVGAYGATSDGGQTGAGKSYVVFGSKNAFSASFNLSSLNGTNGFGINGINENDTSGYSVKSAGDINGDGIDDLIIGAPLASSAQGQSYVVFGSKNAFSASVNFSDLNGTNGFAINGINANDISGVSVSSAGDINGDRIDDLIIGAFGASSGTTSAGGQSYVVFGRKSGFNANLNVSNLDGSNGFVINGLNDNDASGTSVSAGGDINSDGIGDLIIGAPSATSGAGQSYVVYGRKSGFSASFNLSSLNGNNGFAINGSGTEGLGTSVSSAGDINGDGADDLIIGAPNATSGAGQSYVVFGKVNPPEVLPQLTQSDNDVFNIKGGKGKGTLKVTVTGYNSRQVNELGVFTVDDASGKIDGIAPGAAGYAQKALARGRVIFSGIGNLPNGFSNSSINGSLEFPSDSNLRFYLVKNSTTENVLNNVTPITDVLFSDPSNQKITSLDNNKFTLAWKDGSGNSTNDFQNLVVNIQPTDDPLPLGTNLQSQPQGEVIDLRDVKQQVKADFVVNREAAYDNFVGFYRVADENGGIDNNSDGKADILVGQAGYTQAAVKGRVAGIDLSVSNQGTASYTGTFDPGSIFAPFIIINGRPDALLDSNTNNDPAVYFPYLGANTDKVDHIRLLGNNTFGFEDLPNGGDKDFNDVIVRATLSLV